MKLQSDREQTAKNLEEAMEALKELEKRSENLNRVLSAPQDRLKYQELQTGLNHK